MKNERRILEGLSLDGYTSGNANVRPQAGHEEDRTHEHLERIHIRLGESAEIRGVINYIKADLQHLLAPKVILSMPSTWLSRRAIEKNPAAIDIKIAPETSVKMLLRQSTDGFLAWSSDPNQPLAQEDIQKAFPMAESFTQRGGTWFMTGSSEAHASIEVDEYARVGPVIHDAAQAQKIHETGYAKLLAALQKTAYAEQGTSRDPGRSILNNVVYEKRVQWATLEEDGAFSSQDSFQTPATSLGWMMIVPHNHWKHENMSRAYEFSTTNENVPYLMIQPFNMTPEWAAIIDARFRTHLHDRATKIEKGGEAPDADSNLFGDIRGYEASMAAADILSRGEYYRLLDRVINAHDITLQTMIPILKSGEIIPDLIEEGNDVITSEPPRSPNEDGARNALHVISLILRLLHRDAKAKPIDHGIIFMKTIRELSLQQADTKEYQG